MIYAVSVHPDPQLVARRLIDGHPAHFFPRSARQAPAAGVELADAFLFERWLQRQLQTLSGDATEQALQAIRVVRQAMVSERELGGVEVDAPTLEQLPGCNYARLVLGTSNALGINYLLLRLLLAAGHDVRLM